MFEKCVKTMKEVKTLLKNSNSLIEELDLNSRLSGNLLRDLLDFGQIENGKFHLNKELCSLSKIVENTKCVLKRKLQNKEINIKMDIKNADKDCFSQVFVDADRLG